MNENPTFTFTLNLEEANAILAALQELPAKVCNPLSEKIKQQATAQLAAAEQKAAENTPKVVAEEVN